MIVDGLYLLEDLAEAEAALAAGGDWTIQFSDPFVPPFRVAELDPEIGLRPGATVDFDDYISRVNELCVRYGANLTVRFYGYYNDVFDGDVVKLFPEARALMVNCLFEGKNIEAIGTLKHLTSLAMGAYTYKNKDLLHAIPMDRLTYLCLEEFGTKALDLAPLRHAAQLRELRILSPLARNIGHLAELDSLEVFSFAPVKTASLEFIGGMTSLKALKLVLGGTSALPSVSLPSLKDIAVTQTRGFQDLGPLERFPALRRVLISDQPHLEHVTTGALNTELAHLSFWNCPKLNRIEGLSEAPALISLHAVKTSLSPGSCAYPPSMTHLCVHSGRRRDEGDERAAIEALGFIDENHPGSTFVYK